MYKRTLPCTPMKLTIAIDFDGTISYLAPFPSIGRVRPYASEFITLAEHLGHTLILNTCREGEHLEQAKAWLEKEGLLQCFSFFNSNNPELIKLFDNDCRKIGCDWNIDDKNVFYMEESTDTAMDIVWFRAIKHLENL